MMTKRILALPLSLLLAFTASLAAAQELSQPQRLVVDTAPLPADGPVAALAGPGKGWSTVAVARRAAEVAPDVAVARARIVQAEAASAEAWAAVLPRATVSARYTYLGIGGNDPLVAVAGDLDALRARAGQIADPAARDVALAQVDGLVELSQARIDIPRHQIAFNATVAYPVTQLFTEILVGIEATEIGEQARAYELAATVADVRVQAIVWLMNHARAKAALNVAETRTRRARRDLASAKARLDAELGNWPDVLRFRARLAEAQRELAARQAAVSSTAAGLRALLGLEGTGPVAVDVAITLPPAMRPLAPVPSLVASAQAQRPEVAALEAWAESAERGASSARGAVWPSLSVSLGADYARPNTVYSPPGNRFRPSWSASAVLSWSPDAAYASSKKAARVDAEAAVLRRQRAMLLSGVRVEVESAVAEYRAAVAGMRAAKDQVRAASEAYAARRRGYELGATSVTELLAAEIDAHRASLALVDAGADARIRRARLSRALGHQVGG
jgi:outer membrane protein TolC